MPSIAISVKVKLMTVYLMVYFLEIDSLAPRVHPRIIVIYSIRYGMQHNTIKFDENDTITDKVYNSKLSLLYKFAESQDTKCQFNTQVNRLIY